MEKNTALLLCLYSLRTEPVFKRNRVVQEAIWNFCRSLIVIYLFSFGVTRPESQPKPKLAKVSLLSFLYAQGQNSVASKKYYCTSSILLLLAEHVVFEDLNWPGKPKCVIACGKNLLRRSALQNI